jgi:uncharacterized protein DUF4339
MNWYYALEGQSHGPVSEQDLIRLAKEGTVGTDTLLWHPGLEEWDPMWRLLPRAMVHLKKAEVPLEVKGDTERIPLGDLAGANEKADRVVEGMFKRLFGRLRRS